MSGQNQQPIYEQQIGVVRMSVWQNNGANGSKPWYNVTFARRYKDKQGDWKSTNSFNGLADLAVLGEALKMSQEYLRSLAHQAAEENQSEE